MTDTAESKSSVGELSSKERRALLSGVCLSIIAILPVSAAQAALCVDPDELSSVDRSFRKYVEYTEASAKPSETCSNCTSFRPAKTDPGECGSCQVVAGAINAQGHCTGWSPRAVK